MTARSTAGERSPFAVRGIVEGFYGQPWTHQQRLDTIDFIAERGMNRFVYAPKDDPYLRRLWREPHDPAALAVVRELVDACHSQGVDFVYCISPGLTVRYSGDDDLRALLRRYADVAALGVHRFGLLLDDIPGALQHDADRAAFADLIEAQAHLIGRVRASLPPGSELMICPTRYFGYGNEPEITALGRAVDDDVVLTWTGRQICATTIDRDDASRFETATGHRPVFWDNYPVNDVAMTGELHIGPYRGRSVDLADGADGVIANVMPHAVASRIPIATIAAYLRDPVGYDADAAWADALADAVPDPIDRAAFTLFAENCMSSCLDFDDAPTLVGALDRAAFLEWEGRSVAGGRDLIDLAERMSAAAARILAPEFCSPELAAEARPWVAAFALGAEAVAALGNTIVGTGAGVAADRAMLLEFRTRLRATGLRIFGDALDMALSDRVDPFAIAAHAMDEPRLDH